MFKLIRKTTLILFFVSATFFTLVAVLGIWLDRTDATWKAVVSAVLVGFNTGLIVLATLLKERKNMHLFGNKDKQEHGGFWSVGKIILWIIVGWFILQFFGFFIRGYYW